MKIKKFLIFNFQPSLSARFAEAPARRAGGFSVKRGFTLIELLIYMGLLATLLAALTAIFGNILDVQLDSQSLASTEQDTRFIHARLTYDIQRATSVSFPTTFGSPSASLSLIIGGDTYSYTVNGGGNLQVTNSLGTDQLNGPDSAISNLQFQKIGNVGGVHPTVSISFTITSRIQRTSVQ